jgi:hypothetical protein
LCGQKILELYPRPVVEFSIWVHGGRRVDPPSPALAGFGAAGSWNSETEVRPQEIGGGTAGPEFGKVLSPAGGSIEVCSALLKEAEFEVVSLRFELSTAPRIG